MGPEQVKNNILQIQDEEVDPVATTSHLEEQVKVLNHADTFAVFNIFGDFPYTPSCAFGLFYRGCRYLATFEMFINNQKALLLNSLIKDRNEMLTVNLTNDDIRADDEIVTPKGVILIARSKFLFEGICYERITFQNFDLAPHDLVVSFRYVVDFRDIFEVRGVKRIRRGHMLGYTQHSPQCIGFGYQGLDQVHREARLHFSIPFSSVNDSMCEFSIHLTPKSEQVLTIEVEPKDEQGRVEKFSFDDAKHRLVDQLKRNRHLIARIRTDNEQFNHWVDRSTVDFVSLLTVTEDGLYPFAGVPWYNTIFGRDGLISAFLTLWTAPEIAKGVLQFLARHQARETDRFKDAEPGKIIHEMRSGEMANLKEIPFKAYYGTIDATPLFIWLAGEYYQRTGDRETIEKLWPHVEAALDWLDHHGDCDGDGYIEYQRKGEHGLHNQGWKDSHDAISHADGTLAEPPIALCEVQGYAYAARLKAALLAELMGQEARATQLRETAQRLKEQFNRDFWDADLGSYCVALDGNKRPCRVLTSNPGHCLLAGIVDADKAPILAQSLLAPQLFCGWGIRTLSKHSRRFNPLSYHNGSVWPHDNAIVAMGLSRYGLKQEVLSVLNALYDAANRFEGARLPELYCGLRRQPGEGPTRYPVACSPQAWSVAALFGLLQAALGLEIDALEKTLTLNQPMLPDYLRRFSLNSLRLGQQVVCIDFHSYLKDVGVNIPHKPEGWKVVIHK
ncbi:amylo-alpha-1,6-glucosidase [Oligoflexus tunisiensis]|uniref:amylo-alpha-1,6-glucosidase n=1 Tax=Oligoflexus tunisiensis TaxID=708132 RepID=UPI000ACFD618|nr:amylo-alpha-1,6-glucosidase [Oligoflexus tunisiensis]